MGDILIGELEERLLQTFPAGDAADWDHTGLQVGSPREPISRIAVALDPTVANIRFAEQAGCNVLVTHHPPFMEAPESFKPGSSSLEESGANVFEAASRGVALMCFHTALDFNPKGYNVIPQMLETRVIGLLDKTVGSTGKNGYGAICEARKGETVLSLAQLCHDRFDSPVQVWGDSAALVRKFAVGQGSANSLAERCLEEHIDCLVCGEMKYHTALDLSKSGVGIIQLGHDVSEEPFVNLLINEIVATGISLDDIECIKTGNWCVI